MQNVSAEACSDFFVQGFQDPINVFPPDGQVVDAETVSEMVFQWLSVIPIPDFGEIYEFSVYEMIGDQQPQEAVITNEPVYSELMFEAQFFWPIELIAPDGDATYAWTVTPLTPEGFPYTTPNGTSEPTTFVIETSSVAECVSCNIEGFEVLVNNIPTTESDIEPGTNVSYNPVITTECNPPEVAAVIEGYLVVDYVDIEGNTQNYTIQPGESTTYPVDGTVTITFVGQSFCGNGVPCECEGTVAFSHSVVTPGGGEEELTCGCKNIYGSNITTSVNGNPIGNDQNNVNAGQSLSFGFSVQNPECEGNAPDCNMSISWTVEAAFTDAEGNITQFTASGNDPIVMPGPGTLTVNVIPTMMCGEEVCETTIAGLFFNVGSIVVPDGDDDDDTTDDDPPGPDIERPVPEPENPEDPPHVPELPPDTIIVDRCLPIQVGTELGIPIDLGMILDSPSTFPYPRAVPLRAEGVDYDYATFECAGCGDGGSIKKYPVEDRMLKDAYHWKLLTDMGSLNDAFKADSIKNVQAEIDSLTAELSRIENRRQAINERLNTGIAADSSKYKSKLEDTIELRESKDSLIQALSLRIDSIGAHILEDSLIIIELGEQMQIWNDSIANRQVIIDTLQEALLNKPGDDELELLSITEQARQELESLQDSYEFLEEDIIDQSSTLSENVSLQDSLLQLSMEQYTALKNQASSLSQQIIGAETQLFSNPISREYIQRRRQWNTQLNILLAYTSGSLNNNLVTNRTDVLSAALAIATSEPSLRPDLYALFQSKLYTSNSYVNQACGGLDPEDACYYQRTETLEASMLFDSALVAFTASDFTIDALLIQNLDTWRSSLSSIEPQVESADGQVDNASDAYQDALETFVNTMESLEEQKSELLVNLKISEDTLAARELRYMNVVRNREQHFEEIRDPYLALINVSEQSINFFLNENAVLTDSLQVVNEQKQLREDEKYGFEEEKAANEKLAENLQVLIDNLKAILANLVAEEKELKKELEELDKEEEDIKKKIEDLQKLLAQLLTPSKTAMGPIVYFIPPPLEEVMKKMGTYPEFEELVKKVDEAEVDLQLAVDQKQAVQGKLVKETDKAANNLIKYKQAKDLIPDMEQQELDMQQEIDVLKGELTTEYQNNQEKLENILDSVEEQLDTAQAKKQEFAQDSITLRQQITQQIELIETAGSQLKTLKTQVGDSKASFTYQETLLNNSQGTIKEKNNNFKDAGSELKELESTLGRTQHELSTAVAQEDNASIPPLQSSITTLETQIISKQTLLSSIQTDLESASSSNSSNELTYANALTSFENADSLYVDQKNLVDSLKNELIKLNDQLEATLKGLSYWTMVEDKAEVLLKKTNAARVEYQGEVADEVNSDERVKGLQEQLDQLKRDLQKTKDDKAAAKSDVEKSANKKDELEDAEAELEAAQEKLDAANEALDEFILKQFEKVAFDARIELTGDDEVVDKWRMSDPPAKLVKELKYVGSRIPVFQNKVAAGSLGPLNIAATCLPDYQFKVPGPPAEKIPPTVKRYEPRTIALLYEDGKRLWPEWPVIPNDAPKLLAKDVVHIESEFTNDGDVIEYACVSMSSDCPSQLPIADGIVDIGEYNWVPERGSMISGDLDHRYSLWETDLVTLPKVEEEQKIKSEFTGNRIVVDAKVKQESQPMVKPGVMVEVTDSLLGVPNDTKEVQARVVTGDHKGLQGETIEFSCELMEGLSEGYGFGEDTLKVETTLGDGYAKTDFSFGDGFAKFKIYVKWKRGETIIQEEELIAITPIIIELHKLGSSAPEFAWLPAVDIVNSGSASNIDGKTEGFPDCTGDEENENKTECERVTRGVAGLHDWDREYLNEELVLFSSEFPGIELSAEEDTTQWFGIAYTLLDGVGEDQEIDLKAEIEEDYYPLGKPPFAQRTYNTSKIEKFKIGKGNELFLIVLDEPASRGEAINSTGKLGVMPGGVADGLMIPFQQVTLTISDIILEESDDDAPLAKDGSVVWKTESGITETIRNFDLTLDSLVIRAALGAGIGGRVNHDKLNNAVGFYAEFSPEGDFLGNVNNLPQIDLFGFSLKEGASITLDMHSSEGPDIEDNFKGIVIHTAVLVLPDEFSRSETDQKSAIHAKDFYVGSAGIGGEIGLTGSLVSIGCGGFNFEADSIGIKFANHELLGAGIRGSMLLPSPMEGQLKFLATYDQDENFLANITTENPVSIPRLKATFSVQQGQVQWQNNVGELTVSAVITAEDVGPITIQNFKMNSLGEISADAININSTIEFGKGFALYVETIAFAATNSETSLTVKGGFQMGLIGLDKVSGSVTVAPGPSVSVTFDEATISFEAGPVTFAGGFAYSGTEFRGQFDVGIKKIAPNGIKGLFIVGTHPINDDDDYTYWYVEMTMGTKIPIGQTGLSILELGGGVGYNYAPPIGSAEGNPVFNESFSFKAIVGLGTTPTGEIMNSRMEMVYQPGQFSIYGKLWLLTMEENMFGEGQLNLSWAPEAKLDGFVRMFVALPDAEGGIIRFDGKINFLYSAQEKYVRSERIDGLFLSAIEGKALIDINDEFTKLEGSLGYSLNERFEFGVIDVIVAVDVNASGSFLYVNSSSSLSASANFNGAWDVDIDTPLGDANLISGSINLGLALSASPSQVSVSGTASVSWDVWIYSDSAELEMGYTTQL
jgi:chromosome segregation ATPase